MDDISFEKLLYPTSDRVIFRGIWGSYAYGTNTPESDRDTIGVFMMEQRDAAGSAHRGSHLRRESAVVAFADETRHQPALLLEGTDETFRHGVNA